MINKHEATIEERLDDHTRMAYMFADMSSDASRFSPEERMIFAKEASLHADCFDALGKKKRAKIFGTCVLGAAAVGGIAGALSKLLEVKHDV